MTATRRVIRSSACNVAHSFAARTTLLYVANIARLAVPSTGKENPCLPGNAIPLAYFHDLHKKWRPQTSSFTNAVGLCVVLQSVEEEGIEMRFGQDSVRDVDVACVSRHRSTSLTLPEK